MNKLLKLLPILVCVCSCSSLNNKETTNKSEYTHNETYSEITLSNGAIEVYCFNNYGSSATSYHLITTYDSPCSLTNYNNYFTILKDSVTYYYSIPMFQYYFSI